MKKVLLSLAAVACAASMSATSYTLYENSTARGDWKGDANGWTTTVTSGGKTFKMDYNKARSTTDLKSPADPGTKSFRFYKDSELKISTSDMDMKQVVITYDNYEYNGTTYFGELTLSAGWTGVLNDLVYTITSDGLKEITMTASTKQVRILSIVVSDEAGAVTPPVLPDGILYQKSFTDNLDGWEKINDATLSDFNGWKINSNPQCAIANSYWGGENHPANAKLQKVFDLTNATEVAMSFEQGFGYDFPTAQNDNARVYVINMSVNHDAIDYLTMANFPPAPASGNWTKEWTVNEFDLSEYEGSQIAIGFEYANDGSKSRAWEIKNFVLKGKGTLAVKGIEFEEENVAPVYYNLQGVRVNNPENGIFIEVKGSKATKVVF